nr:ribonuclease H-like domain-containing protein [Tanacetum cinerariifolium]
MFRRRKRMFPSKRKNVSVEEKIMLPSKRKNVSSKRKKEEKECFVEEKECFHRRENNASVEEKECFRRREKDVFVEEKRMFSSKRKGECFNLCEDTLPGVLVVLLRDVGPQEVVPAHKTRVLDIIFTPRTYKDVFYSFKLFENIFTQASIRGTHDIRVHIVKFIESNGVVQKLLPKESGLPLQLTSLCSCSCTIVVAPTPLLQSHRRQVPSLAGLGSLLSIVRDNQGAFMGKVMWLPKFSLLTPICMENGILSKFPMSYSSTFRVVLATSSLVLLQQIIGSQHNEFDMTDLEELNYFLGISATRSPTGLFLSQKKYALQLLERAHMVNCNPSRTPIDTESKLGPKGVPVQDHTLYRRSRTLLLSNVSCATFGMWTLVSSCTFMLLLPWLVMQMLIGQVAHPHAYLLQVIVSFWVIIVCLGHLNVSTHSLSRSSTEAEYRGVANVVAEIAWLRNLLRELYSPPSTATLVYYDNVSAVYMSVNRVQHQR